MKVGRSPADVALAGEALLLILAFRLALWASPFPTIDRALRLLFRRERASTGSQYDHLRAGAAVRRASRVTPGARCLPRALAGLVICRQLAVPATVHIGVRGAGSEPFSAHAWLETRWGIILGGEDAASFARILTIGNWSGKDGVTQDGA